MCSTGFVKVDVGNSLVKVEKGSPSSKHMGIAPWGGSSNLQLGESNIQNIVKLAGGLEHCGVRGK